MINIVCRDQKILHQRKHQDDCIQSLPNGGPDQRNITYENGILGTMPLPPVVATFYPSTSEYLSGA